MNHRVRFFLVLLAAAASASERSNELVHYEDPNAALEGMWAECVAGLSFTCVQRKTLSFIDRLGRADRVPLLGGVLTLVRTGDTPTLGRSVDAIDDTDTLGRLVDQAVDSFFDTHVIRLTTPRFLSKDGRSSSTVDFNVAEVDSFEGRKGGGGGGGGHGGGGGGKRGMKKMMMMMCMMMVGKMMMMGPLMMGLTKIIALKALLLGSISLLISKIMILKKLKMGGGLGGGGFGGGGGGGWNSGGGGGGWSSGGGSGGGWDRAAHNMAYSAYATSE